MSAIDISICRHDDFVVPGLLNVELIVDTGPDRSDHRLNLVVGQNLVDPALLNIQDLSPEGQHRLGCAIPGLLRRATGGVTLDHKHLGVLWVPDRAVSQFAGKG